MKEIKRTMNIKKLIPLLIIGIGAYLLLSRRKVYAEEIPEEVVGNLIKNGSFENWSAGPSLAPDGWSLYSSGGYGTIARESKIKHKGSYSAKLTKDATGTYVVLYQYLYSNDPYCKGKTFTFSAWVYATQPNKVRLVATDDSVDAYSAFHPGNSAWQLLTVTKTPATNNFNVSLRCEAPSGVGYIDDATCIENKALVALEGQSLIENFISIERPQQQLEQQLLGRILR